MLEDLVAVCRPDILDCDVDFVSRIAPTPKFPKVAAIIVSHNRPLELAITISCVRAQTLQPQIVVIDSSDDDSVLQGIELPEDALRLRSVVNLGGAGSYALGLLQGLALGGEWIWLMDDDGRPHDPDSLAALLEEAEAGGLDAVAPIVIDSTAPGRFAFPYPINGRYVFSSEGLAGRDFIPGMAHLFNGLLIRSTAVYRVGLPDLRMFIRGDEVDFLLRMRRAGLRFGTTTKSEFFHPSSNAELHPVFGGRLYVVYPLSGWKRRCQYRNRAYNDIRHRRFLLLLIDLLRYPYFFLLVRRLDLTGFREWLRSSWEGWRGNVQPEPSTIPPSQHINKSGVLSAAIKLEQSV